VLTLPAILPTGIRPVQIEILRKSIEPMLFTGVLVTGAVAVFAVVAHEAVNPLRTFRRVALTALLLSFVPDIAAAFWSLFSWPVAIVYMVMHVVAWAVTVTMLTRLTASNSPRADAA
jgi:hypothetical protein